MSVEYTKEQKKVINTRGRNLLVSAAAGSGKTAVLVERIISIITDKESPVDIDRLLVVTFTEAAAYEMRERIGKAIDDALLKDPLNTHLQRQAALLYKAQISTIHSFCLSVIRNNFNDIGLDPSFRIADEIELKLMSEDVLNELFEEKYAEHNEDFLRCVEYYTRGVRDDALKEYICKLSELADGHPWQAEWLNDCTGQYNITSVTELYNSEYMNYLMDYTDGIIKDALSKNEKAAEISGSFDGPTAYMNTLLADRDILEGLLRSKNYEELRDNILNISFPKLPSKAGEGCAEENKEKVKALREQYKSIITGKRAGSLARLCALSADEELMLLKELKPVVYALKELVSEYMERFKAQRLLKGVISFSDMEHYALDILYTSDSAGNHIPSDTAIGIRQSFSEILMDEYQDCNRVQELLISAVSGEADGVYNRFMVGDVKQSIYKFRLASPELFIDKYNRYKIDDQDGHDDIRYERINLHKNFRSRESVINTVNNLFSQIMHKYVGGVEYDKEAYLVAGAEFPDLKTQDIVLGDDDSEVLLLELNNVCNLDKGVQEAYLIADRIRKLKKTQLVKDKETGKLRPVMYKDIVILLRSMTDVAEGIRYVFAREGIPFYMSIGTGFYDTREISALIQLLKVIDNPFQDIPLYGTLISYFGGFSDEEIAAIRINEKKGSLYEQLLSQREQRNKIDKFLSLIEKYRYISTYTPIHELLIKIINETGYINYVSALSGGAQRKANVRMLINKAASFEAISYRGLFHFVRYIKELKKTDKEEGEADISDENADVVRIMTVHKSKGLEFPICFISGANKQFNRDDTKGSIITDMDYGLASSYVDLELRVRLDTLYKRTVALKLSRDMTGEELRVLYVAMTRAKEKLIITGAISENDREKYEDVINEAKNGGEGLEDISGASSYLDFIKPIMGCAKIIKYDDLAGGELLEAAERLSEGAHLAGEILLTNENDAEYKELKARISRRYPHTNLEGMILKTSVSELKKAYLDFENTADMFEAEKLLYDEDTGDSADSKITSDIKIAAQNARVLNISGTDRGSAYHKVMELLDFNDKEIKSQINLFIKDERISQEWADAVSVKKIEEFMRSPLAARMGKAQTKGRLKREQPFVLGIAANRVNERFPDTETILLQGIIDAFFMEDNEIVLVDYKTDVIKSGEALMQRYHVQLDYYAEALERILGMKVKERVLYSFYLGETVAQ